MGLSFLAPIFFAGLAALAIPILIHLTYRQKATVVPFPSLMFVQKIPFKSMRRQKIRHWLLFLLRCAALVLLALAFSRPFFDQANIAAALSASSREVVILVDNSNSMSYGDRWQRAVEAARGTIDGLTTSDRASLVFFSDAAQLAVRSTPEASVLHGALETGSVSRRGTRYAPAIGLAQQILTESDLPSREVVLITDYQKAGWDADQSARLPEGTQLTGIDVAEGDASSNLSVATLLLQREAGEDGEQVGISARLTNQGEEPFAGVDVELEVGGEVVETRSVSLEPNSASTVQFSPFLLRGERLRGVVRAGTDELPDDNDFYFILNPGETLSILVLSNRAAHETDSFFFERALSVGTRPAFRQRVMPAAQLAATDLEGVSLVVINDAPMPTGGAGAALRRYVEGGGGLFVALGELVRPTDWQGADARALAPPFADVVVDRNAEFGGALASYDRTHSIFEMFAVPRSGDFTAASFYRYWRLEPDAADQVLAGFDDGSPALVARAVGSGRVVVWPSTLDRFWNDFATQPVYVPFIHAVAEHVSGYQEAAAWQIVGSVLRLATLDDVQIIDGTEVMVTEPEGGRRELTAGADAGPVDPEQATDRLEIEAPGFYELTWSEDAGERVTLVAANLDRSESDLAKLDGEELASALRVPGAALTDIELAAAVTAEDREARQSFWWYLIAFLVALLAFETLLSNKISPSSATRGA